MDQTRTSLQRIRAYDWEKDSNPKHWKKINGSLVHLYKDGNFHGCTGDTFNGRYHYGPGGSRRPSSWKVWLLLFVRGSGDAENVAPQWISKVVKLKQMTVKWI